MVLSENQLHERVTQISYKSNKPYCEQFEVRTISLNANMQLLMDERLAN